ncbi:hypothetical protein H4582DRAFT_2062637 [Lactarius indigo]|nr:hypothetical protein H4582DRAFT_2062637 [Lactarius indigo]
MRSHSRHFETTGHLFSESLPGDTHSSHSTACATATSTSRDGPSNDLKFSGGFWKELEKKGSRLQAGKFKNINMLPDDVLLEVFDFYRMSGKSLCPTRIKTAWNWYELVHVCTRWRRIIFGSPRRLDLLLICTRGTPVRRSLGCWPAFPIAIDFYPDRRFGGTGTTSANAPWSR